MTSPKHGLPAPFTTGGNILTNVSVTNNQTSNTKAVFSQSSEGTNSGTSSNNVRSVTPIGPPHRNNTPTSNLSSINCPQGQGGASQVSSSGSGGQTNSAGIIGNPMQSKMIGNSGGNLQAQAHEYSLFNDNSYGSQWDNNQYTASVKAKQIIIEHEVPVKKVDASKAPGYRGNAISSPVSSVSKPSSQSTTPPSTNQGMSILPNTAGVIGSQPPSQQHQQQQQSYPSPNDAMQSATIKATAPIQPPQNLAVQRPLSGVNSMRQMPPTMDTYSLAPGPPSNVSLAQQQQQQSSISRPEVRGNMFDNFQQPPPSQQQQQQPNYYSGGGGAGDSYNNSGLGPIGMSRLNPKANAFNTMPQSASAFQGGNANKGPGQGYGGMYGNGSVAVPGNNYASQQQQQKLTQNNMAPYQNRAPGAPPNNQPTPQQQQQLNGAGMRWGYPDLGYAPSARDMMSLENGMSQMGMSSPSMSPNSAPNGMNSGGPGTQSMDEARKTRPIGAERLWKYNTFSTGVAAPLDLDNAVGLGGQGPSGWNMDKPPQNQMPLQWIQQPPIGRGAFGDELVHGTESFQVRK